MIETFKIKASNFIALAIVVSHVISVVLIVQFAVPIVIKLMVGVIVICSLNWQLLKWHKSNMVLRFQPSVCCWSTSIDSKHWLAYSAIKKVYLCDVFVWIVLSSPGKVDKPVILSVDSLEGDKFIQLRRCILCPELFS